MSDEQLEILKMVEAGQITAEEAALLLASLDAPALEAPAQEPGREIPSPAAAPFPEGNRWSEFWRYPFVAGAAVLALGITVLILLSLSGAAAGWLVCGWVPILLGALVVAGAWWSKNARWLHLRISEPGERKIAISFPLPLTLSAWVLRIAQPFVPQLKDTGVDDLILALRDSAHSKDPLYIDVQDEEEGEHVEVYFG